MVSNEEGEVVRNVHVCVSQAPQLSSRGGGGGGGGTGEFWSRCAPAFPIFL